MKENTQGSNAELYLGEMITDEKGKVTIPPKYSYKVTFNDKNCMIIPLEETKQEKTKQKEKIQHKVKEKMMIYNTKQKKKGGKTYDR